MTPDSEGKAISPEAEGDGTKPETAGDAISPDDEGDGYIGPDASVVGGTYVAGSGSGSGSLMVGTMALNGHVCTHRLQPTHSDVSTTAWPRSRLRGPVACALKLSAGQPIEVMQRLQPVHCSVSTAGAGSGGAICAHGPSKMTAEGPS